MRILGTYVFLKKFWQSQSFNWPIPVVCTEGKMEGVNRTRRSAWMCDYTAFFVEHKVGQCWLRMLLQQMVTEHDTHQLDKLPFSVKMPCLKLHWWRHLLMNSPLLHILVCVSWRLTNSILSLKLCKGRGEVWLNMSTSDIWRSFQLNEQSQYGNISD